MLAAVTRRNRIAVLQKPLPRLKPGWALVRVRLAGICNTDIEILRGYHNFHGTLGHEFVGDVVRVASAKDRAWIGRRVVGEINLACAGLGFRKPCSYCRRGIPTQCARRRVLGIIGHDGAFAEYLALPVVNLHRVPAGIADEAAVFTEPLAAACEILEQVNIRAHREAAVIGDGKLAQLIARVLRASGLRVVMIGKHASKLRLAHLADIQTERCHSPRAPCEPIFTDRRGHRLALGPGPRAANHCSAWNTRPEIHISRRRQRRDVADRREGADRHRLALRPFSAALALLRSGRVDPRPLISRVFSLKDAAKAIRYAQQRGVMKVLLRVS